MASSTLTTLFPGREFAKLSTGYSYGSKSEFARVSAALALTSFFAQLAERNDGSVVERIAELETRAAEIGRAHV